MGVGVADQRHPEGYVDQDGVDNRIVCMCREEVAGGEGSRYVSMQMSRSQGRFSCLEGSGNVGETDMLGEAAGGCGGNFGLRHGGLRQGAGRWLRRQHGACLGADEDPWVCRPW